MIQKPFISYGFKLYFKIMGNNVLRPPSPSPLLSSRPFSFVPVMLNIGSFSQKEALSWKGIW